MTYVHIPQPFASASFANLLIQLGPTLKNLSLTNQVDFLTMSLVDLQEEPHNGSLDQALRSCVQLEQLSIPYQLSATRFLEAQAYVKAKEAHVADTTSNVRLK